MQHADNCGVRIKLVFPPSIFSRYTWRNLTAKFIFKPILNSVVKTKCEMQYVLLSD